MISTKNRAPHTFAGAREGQYLATWLNEDIAADRKLAALRRRIAQLIEDMNTNSDLLINRGKADPVLTERIDRELLRYPLRVQTWQVQDAGKYKSFPEPRWLFSWSSAGGGEVAQVIFYIVRLGERGLLRRIRPCMRCSSWFFAKFNHQRFCEKRCQVLHYQTGEYWKQRRRERHHER